MSETKWADLSREEKAARIKAGKAKKAAEREAVWKAAAAPLEAETAAPKPVAAEVKARNLEAEFQPLTDEELKKLTPAEVEARRARLTAAIDSLPTFVSPGAKPGTIIGSGLTAEYAPYTREWFLDVEERKKENPEYQLHEVIPNKWGFVKVNGVAFGYMPSKRCLLPTPHYLVYLENLAAPDKVAEEFKAPANVPIQAGYMSPVHLMPGTWVYTPITKE